MRGTIMGRGIAGGRVQRLRGEGKDEGRGQGQGWGERARARVWGEGRGKDGDLPLAAAVTALGADESSIRGDQGTSGEGKRVGGRGGCRLGVGAAGVVSCWDWVGGCRMQTHHHQEQQQQRH